MKFVDTIKNIFKIEELKQKLVYTILLVLVYRFGSFVVIPGINPVALAELGNTVNSSGLLSLLDIFSGGAFSNASVFALGIMPYISASIVIQLLGIIVPYFQKLQKEGESGRRKMNQWTRYLTIIVLCLQGPAYLATLHSQIPAEAFLLSGTFFTAVALACLVAGTMFTMWLGEKITDKGIGNGVSLIIMVGIIARLPFAFWSEVTTRFGAGSPGGIVMLVVELILLYLIFMASIALVQAVRKVPVQYAKRIVGNKQYGGVRQYIPLKVNAAGVMPIIFAQALMVVPMFFQNFGNGCPQQCLPLFFGIFPQSTILFTPYSHDGGGGPARDEPVNVRVAAQKIEPKFNKLNTVRSHVLMLGSHASMTSASDCNANHF